MNMIKLRNLFLVFFLLFPVSFLYSETFILKDLSKIEGEVLLFQENQFTIQLNNGQVKMLSLEEIYVIYPGSEEEETLSKIEMLSIKNSWSSEKSILVLEDDKALKGEIKFYQKGEVYFESEGSGLKTYSLKKVKLVYFYSKNTLDKKIEAEKLKLEKEREIQEEALKKQKIEKEKKEKYQTNNYLGIDVEIEKEKEKMNQKTDSLNLNINFWFEIQFALIPNQLILYKDNYISDIPSYILSCTYCEYSNGISMNTNALTYNLSLYLHFYGENFSFGPEISLFILKIDHKYVKVNNSVSLNHIESRSELSGDFGLFIRYYLKSSKEGFFLQSNIGKIINEYGYNGFMLRGGIGYSLRIKNSDIFFNIALNTYYSYSENRENSQEFIKFIIPAFLNISLMW
ncbi:MAG: hypothetical protein A2Y41_14355 [Spirochaetes bacterium GWB1_36_13]|nr:MAG: hypothetical protein A2Y41_14355 [Spirochaetes bacterium GWB1_36_13]